MRYIIVGWGDEQIEGWKIMLERNVRFSSTLFLSTVG